MISNGVRIAHLILRSHGTCLGMMSRVIESKKKMIGRVRISGPIKLIIRLITVNRGILKGRSSGSAGI